MKQMRRIFTCILVVFFLFIPGMPASAEQVINLEGKDLSGYTVILHTNDSHGRVVPDSNSGYMGFTAVSALKKYCEAAGAQVILLDAGDTLHGLPIATLEKGESVVKLMNMAGYDAMAPGNHDFNYGAKRLLELKTKMDFPLLSANVTYKISGERFLPDNTIIEKNGVKYGIFGLSTPETAYKTNPNNVTEIEFTNPVEAAKTEVADLEAKDADVIIALAHLGTDKSSEFTSDLVAEKVDGIDLIVDGHSHTVFESGSKVGDTLIVSTGDYTRYIGAVTIDPKGNITAGLVNSTVFQETDKNIDTLLADISAEQEKLLSEVVGRTSVYLDGVRENVRTRETNLGNLATDAFRYATGADVALTNGGGIRASIEAGDITKKDLVTVFPFGNYVVTKNVTGQAIIDAMEVGAASYPEPLGGFPQVSGITFEIDASKPSGSRVVNLKINGTPVDPAKTYLLATNDFIVAGGDGYTMFTGFDIVNEYGAMEEIIINYINERKSVNSKVEGRITVINESGVKEDTEAVSEAPDKTAEENKSKEDTPQAEAAGEKKGQSDKGKEAAAGNGAVKDGTGKNSTGKNDTEKEAVKDSTKDYQIYVVVKGDYLRKISVSFFGKESDWKKIYEWNKDIIANPDKIQIGQRLKIYQ